MRDGIAAGYRKRMGVRLFKAALKAGQCISLREAKDIVRRCPARKKTSIKAAAEMVLALRVHVGQQRKNRVLRRCKAHGVPDAKPCWKERGRRLRPGREILEERVALCMLRAGLRKACSGDYSLRVGIGTPGVECSSYKGDRYSRACKYRKTDISHRITVAPGWTRLPPELRIVDGVMNLACTEEAEDVYKAVWVRQGQGFNLRVEEGFIARHPELGTAHGKTIGAARAVLANRRRARQLSMALSRIEASLRKFKANGVGDVAVRFCDSLRAGNCKAGTEVWVEKHFPGRTEASIAEIITVEDQHRYVVAACLQAIRRQSGCLCMEQ